MCIIDDFFPPMSTELMKIYHGFIGAFEDQEIIHVDDSVDPVRDLETIGEELRLKALSNLINKL